MRHCWAPDPKDRPTAEEVLYTLSLFTEMIDKTSPAFNDTVFEQFEMAEGLRLQKGFWCPTEKSYHERYTSTLIDVELIVTTKL